MREELHQMYRELYHAYCMLNRICWGGTLPRCVLAVSGTQRHCWAYASPRCAAGCPLIAVNSTACGQIDNDHFLGILAHEMIHIRQFAQGRRGGHGRDFKKEMLRLGVDLDRQLFFEDSPLYYTIRLYRSRSFDLTACFASMRRGDFNRQEQIEFYLENQTNLFQ